MCGIVGASSTRNIVPVLIDGIKRLEYRGYDSTGLAVINGTPAQPRLERLVSTARVADLAAQADSRSLKAFTGISHTRWATHGAPTPANARGRGARSPRCRFAWRRRSPASSIARAALRSSR